MKLLAFLNCILMQVLDYELLKTYEHDPKAFSQGVLSVMSLMFLTSIGSGRSKSGPISLCEMHSLFQ